MDSLACEVVFFSRIPPHMVKVHAYHDYWQLECMDIVSEEILTSVVDPQYQQHQGQRMHESPAGH